jgi:hypothetical protein
MTDAGAPVAGGRGPRHVVDRWVARIAVAVADEVRHSSRDGAEPVEPDAAGGIFDDPAASDLAEADRSAAADTAFVEAVRAELTAIVRADVEARQVEAAEMRRILADQSDAVDDTNEVFGRVLARLNDEVLQLRAEVVALRDELRRRAGSDRPAASIARPGTEP